MANKLVSTKTLPYSKGGTSTVNIYKTDKGWEQEVITGNKITSISGVGNYGTSSALPKSISIQNQVYTDPLGQPVSYDPNKAKSNKPLTNAFGMPIKTDILGRPINITLKKGVVNTLSLPGLSKNKLDNLSNTLRDKIQVLRTQNLRNKGKFTFKREINLAELTAKKYLVDVIRNYRDTPKMINEIRKHPSIIKELPSVILEEGEQLGRLIRESPTEVITIIGTDIIIAKGSYKALNLLERTGTKAITKLSPKYIGKLSAGRTYTVKLKLPKTNKTIKLKLTKLKAIKGKLKGSRILKASIRKKGAVIRAFKKGKRIQTIKLKAVKRIPTMSLKKQIRLSGRTISPVSSQAQRTVKILMGRKIKKPLRTKLKLNRVTKKLLKKFDNGKITKKELARLNKNIKKAGSKGLLERSFFADSYARIRPSRLGLTEKEANFLDYLSGDITFKKSRPQILVFKKQVLSKFPKSLKRIARKIEKGKRLSSKEKNKLLAWQLKKAKRFKPLGFLTRESEATLSPGTILKRERTAGVSYYKGRRLPIIQTKTIKPSSRLKKLIKKAKSGKLTRKEVKTFRKLYKKESGFKLKKSAFKKTSSSYNPKGKYFSLKKALLSLPKRGLAYKKPRIHYYKKPTRGYNVPKRIFPGKYVRYPGRITSGTSATTKPTYYKTPSKTTRIKYPPKIIKRPPKTIKNFIGKRQEGRKIKVYPRGIEAFNVYGKSGRKFIKINKMPLTKKDALSRGTYAIDHSTSKTFKIIPIGKAQKVGMIRAKEGNYFNRKGYKIRGVKIRHGRKYKLLNKYIEKRRFGIDTGGEKRGLTLARLKKSKKW